MCLHHLTAAFTVHRSLVCLVLFLISHSVSLFSLSFIFATYIRTDTQAQRWQMPGSPRAHYDPVHHRVTSHKTCGISSGKCWKQSLCPGPAYNRSPRLWCWCCEEPQDMSLRLLDDAKMTNSSFVLFSSRTRGLSGILMYWQAFMLPHFACFCVIHQRENNSLG